MKLGSHGRCCGTPAAILALGLVSALGAGCGDDEPTCSMGWTVRDGVCVPPDAGDGDMDAGPDDGGIGDGGGSDADAGGEPPLDRYLDDLAGGLCDKALQCESKLGLAAVAQVYCHPSFLEALAQDFGSGGLSFRPGKAELDPERAADCLEALAEADCTVAGEGLNDESCFGAIRGTVEPGDSCWSEVECRSGECVGLDSMCEGTCVAYGADGESCGSMHPDGRECEPALRCVDGTCEALAASGESCEGSSGCVTGLWCNPETDSCEELPDAGELCDTTLGGDPCLGDLVCTEVSSGSPKECATGKDVDEACSFDEPCRPGLRCHPDTDVCVELSALGEPCDTRYNCPTIAVCAGGTCTAQPLPGEECDAERECLAGACPESTCTFLGEGDTCADDDECRSDRCSFSSLDGGMPDAGTCEAAGAEGDGCEDDQECDDGLGCLGGACTSCERFGG